MSDQEIKKDAGKTRLDLIPVECIDAIGKVLTFGAAKYHDNSWREGINYSRVYAATQRHLQAFWGEAPDIDEESKLSHLSHAFCNLAFLLAYEENKERYQTFDDRAGSNNNNYYKEREEKIAHLLDLVQNNPKFFGCRWGDDKLDKLYDTLDYAIHSPYTTIKEEEPAFPDLTKMTNEEACSYLKSGMKVRILRSASADEKGWVNIWTTRMNSFIGETRIIDKVNNVIGVCFTGSYWGSFPAFVLEIISNPEQEEEPAFPDLTKMTHPEACEHLEVGMGVKVLFKGESHAHGWGNCWYDMDEAIGNEFIVEVIEKYGVRFKDSDFWQGFPAFVLEIVSGPEEIE